MHIVYINGAIHRYAKLAILIGSKREKLILMCEQEGVVFTKSDLSDLVGQIERTRHSELAIVLVVLLLAEVFTQAVDLTLRVPHN